MTEALSVSDLRSQSIDVLPEREAMALVNANIVAPVNIALALNVASDNSIAFASANQTIGNITQTT